jgi:hypothetical protein
MKLLFHINNDSIIQVYRQVRKLLEKNEDVIFDVIGLVMSKRNRKFMVPIDKRVVVVSRMAWYTVCLTDSRKA